MGNPSPQRQIMLDKKSQWSAIREAAKHGPLQSLTERELDVRNQPLTIYPWAAQRPVRAWVRFGPESIRVDANPPRRYGERMPAIFIAILLTVVALIVLYFIIRGAVTSALRQSRNEARIEKDNPENAYWLSALGRDALMKAKES